jgi:hypothetical protein
VPHAVEPKPVQFAWWGGANGKARVPCDKGRTVARRIRREEFHLTVYAPCGLPAQEYDAMRQALDDLLFLARLHPAVRGVIRRNPVLRKAKVRWSR